MSSKPKPLTPAAVDTALPQSEEIPASQFRRSPGNRLISQEKILKMSDSIRQVGILQPITARYVENPETGGRDLEIVLGESRWLGASDLDPEYPVPCIIRNLSDKDAVKIRSVENFQRTDLDVVEEAFELRNLKAVGWNVEEIMVFTGRKKDYIYQRLTLLDLSEDAHTAIREGNLALLTAAKIASLPEESRAEALAAVVRPTHSAKSLSERQAVELLDKNFIEPAKRAKEWEKRRDVILENHPGAKWNDYQTARNVDNFKSGFIRADKLPDGGVLSDAAREGQLVVNSWGDLARKHGAALVIGCDYAEEAHAYVDPKPLIDAEKAACTDNPGDCIFVHEAAVHIAREASERRKREFEIHVATRDAEILKISQMILTGDRLAKTVAAKLVTLSFVEISENYLELHEYAVLLGIKPDADDTLEKTESAILKHLKNKIFSPFEASARLQLAAWIMNARPNSFSALVFEAGLGKPADFPALHLDYQNHLVREKTKSTEG